MHGVSTAHDFRNCVCSGVTKHHNRPQPNKKYIYFSKHIVTCMHVPGVPRSSFENALIIVFSQDVFFFKLNTMIDLWSMELEENSKDKSPGNSWDKIEK